ncbi:HAD-IC family P-type ATPase [Streptomyces fagopyri]|uniref:HAD-IC family P-type ATPase n=1 Tax=Streptomyces fagopyri TaxID=2662397 RepID=A0A5Q0LPW0_9ACTN|nr:HAD-IC family P-type ATPase [Streptomyces fagopyri]QFZ79111.1 HAD-IC family P-type ATPase [Streptomyces fagopyri]
MDSQNPQDPQPPDSLTSLQVLRRLDSGPRGLTEAEAAARLLRFGAHTVPVRDTESWPRLAARSLRDPFTAVLLCLGLVSATVAAWGTACVILALVAVSCVLRAAGENRADRSLAGLRRLVADTATVVRRADPDGPPTARDIPVGELVPGDVVRLGAGDLVPADVRLLRANGLSVRQSALTGESAAVTKNAADVPSSACAGDRTGDHEGDRTGDRAGAFARGHLCFQGSSVVTGSGTAVVLATGTRTRFAAAHAAAAHAAEAGSAAARGGARLRRVLRGRARREEAGRSGPRGRGASAVERSVASVSLVLIRFMLLTPPLVLMANAALRGRGLETLPFAVAVAVGLTPEMLPVIVSTSLARGASLLARTRGVIVKRLPALHDLGAIDVLCLDKTGTLTQDRPVVERAVNAFGTDDPEVLRLAAVNAWWTLQLAELPAPDALDGALLEAAAAETAPGKGGAETYDGVAEAYDGVAALPFDPVRRLATAVVRRPRRLGVHTLVVKGAVEEVLRRCDLAEDEREGLLGLAARQADDGLRLLAVATAERLARRRDWTPADERGLTFRGFVTFRDALAPTAAEALRRLIGRGISVRVLTGDHPGTARRACRDLGLEPGEVRTAYELDGLAGAELAAVVRRTTVFARCAPEDKARIIAALRADGRTVGFLGDGVNDLPALRIADVGIAPWDAVDVARQSADVVLADKDLAAIDHAVTAGRHSGVTVATYLRVTLSSNLGNVVAMLAAGLSLPFLPMLPAQVLAQNLCFDAAQLAFAYDRPHPDALRRPASLRPRRFLRFITGFGLLNAVADLATFAVLALALHGPDAIDESSAFHSGWFSENLTTQALVMLVLRTGLARTPGIAGPGVTSPSTGRRRPGMVGAAAGALALAGLLVPLTPLGGLLGMIPLPPLCYALLATVLALYAAALTVARRIYERRS